MAKDIRNSLLGKGYFPEILPPCFDSQDLNRCFKGMLKSLKSSQFNKKRDSNYIRYSGTKHDGSRRLYGTVNPICYFYVCDFISDNWPVFETKFKSSPYNMENIRLGDKDEDRAVIVPTMSELSEKMSNKISYSPYILKTDIAQFFPSIYTHSLSWAAHGLAASKSDRAADSKVVIFNQLDHFMQNCQSGQTRGIVVGPDAFRLVAEFISCEIDKLLELREKDRIIGAVRHVDDFYLGVLNEINATVVLSQLRDVLQNYELQINDSKTKILSSLEQIDDMWAQDLRKLGLNAYKVESLLYALDKAQDLSRQAGSQSPLKLILRRFDKAKCYKFDAWNSVEPKLQRILYHHSHCANYICLLLAKRFAIKKAIDIKGWGDVISILLRRHITFNHHHEICWLLWTAFVCKIELDATLIEELSGVENGHVKSLLIAGYQKKLTKHKPKISLGIKLSSTDENWLANLVARSTGYSRAPFSGAFLSEFEILAKKKVKLINFETHMKTVASSDVSAISSSKYGYDDEGEEDIDMSWFDPDYE